MNRVDPPTSRRVSILPEAPALMRSFEESIRRARPDLGVRKLLPEWRQMIRAEHFWQDLAAGWTVACIALPLSLAIALASDVPAGVGLVTAIVAGVVCAFFAGQPLGVSGPAAAMAVPVGQIVDQHGLGGLLVVGLGAGLLQVLTGMIGVGRIMKLIPLSVVHGFTAGIGVLILVGQLPRALGLHAPDESHVFDVVAHVARYVAQARPAAVVISGSVVLAMLALPRFFPRVPIALIAVLVPTLAASFFPLDVPLLGALPHSLPVPSLPALPSGGLWPLVNDIFVIYTLCSLQSLLSASAVDKLRGPDAVPHDPDQELVSQGLGNMVASLFGGIPVTNVVARSAVNVQAGARTRRAAVIHALALLVCIYVIPEQVGRMPIPALAGVLLATGIRMLDARYLRELWAASRTEAMVFVITTVAMVSFDLLSGVQAGLVVALFLAVIRLSRSHGALQPARSGAPHQISFTGPLTFLTTARLEQVRAALVGLEAKHGLVLDVRHVDSIDTTAAMQLLELARAWRGRGGKVAVLGPSAELTHRLVALAPEAMKIRESFAHVERDLDEVLGNAGISSTSHAHMRLTRGVEKFRARAQGQLSPLFEKLGVGQTPHTLFLTCADSRVSPSELTGSTPGELFVVRNIGALLPPVGHSTLNDEGAAIEYAVRVLGVRNIVICGHSSCGAMTALRDGAKVLEELPALAHWARGAGEIAGDLSLAPSVDDATRGCSVRQLEHLRQYPVVSDHLAKGELRIQAWFYDVERGDVQEWDPERQEYVSVGERDLTTL